MRAVHVGISILVLVSIGAGVATAHGNTVVVSDQVSADGTVLIEHVSYLDDAYVVARTATGDGPGEPVGHHHLEIGGATFGERDLLRLSLDDSYWTDREGADRLWVVLHHDGGGDGFSLSDDPLIEQGGEPAGSLVTVASGDANVSVAAFDQEANATVTVRRVELADPGYVVVHGNTTDGPVVGRTALEAGVHHNVSVELNGYYYNDREDRFGLTAVAYSDDGDGTFDAAADDPVRAGDAAVASGFQVDKAVETVDVTPTETSTPTPSPTPTATESPTGTVTPTATATPTRTAETAQASPTATASPIPATDGTPGSADDEDDVGTTADGSGPAVGPLMAVVVVVVGGLLVARRR